MAYIVNEGCPGCGTCKVVCPVKAIAIEKGKAVIQQDKCIQCGICASKCPVKLIEKKEDKTASTEDKSKKNVPDKVKAGEANE